MVLWVELFLSAVSLQNSVRQFLCTHTNIKKGENCINAYIKKPRTHAKILKIFSGGRIIGCFYSSLFKNN